MTSKRVYLPMMTPSSQAKLKFQMFLIINLLQLLNTQTILWFPEGQISKLFLSPTNRKEIQDISSLNPNKSVGPNSIPKRILELLKMTFLGNYLTYLTFHYPRAFFPLSLRLQWLSMYSKKILDSMFQTNTSTIAIIETLNRYWEN